jgi:hypothetical protein
VTPIDWNPSAPKLRRFGWVALVAFASLGLSARAALHPATSVVFFVVGAMAALSSLVTPRANRPLYVALLVVGWPVRVVVSNALLVIVFYGVVTPIGVLRRLFAGDPLTRRLDKGAATYWLESKPRRPADDYFRSF